VGVPGRAGVRDVELVTHDIAFMVGYQLPNHTPSA